MKKIIAVLLIFCLTAMTGCGKTAVQTEKETAAAPELEETAVSFADDLVQGRFAEAYENYEYTEKMKAAVSAEYYEKNIGGTQNKFGDFVEMKTPFAYTKDGYVIISIPMVFSNSKINYNVVFDDKNEIAGFNFGKYEEKGASVAEVENEGVSIVDTAKGYAGDLMEGNYEKAYSDYPHDAAMTGAVNAEAYKNMIEQIKANAGDFVALEEPFTFDIDVYTSVDVPVKMTKENFNIEIYFDAGNNIAGLKFVPYGHKTETEMPDNIIETELTADVNGHQLGGTLTLPKEGGNFPCVILVHGSGPNDRDETILANKPFRDIAWGLASRGIAVYRYDKRSYAYNAEFQTGYDLTIYDETIDDAAAIAQMLKETEGIDADKIYILGHSLGGYAMPRIAENAADAAGYIIMAGSARAPHELIPGQYEYLFGLDGEVGSDEQAALDLANADYEKIENIDDYNREDIFMGMYKAYIKDLISYDPIETAKSIEKPVLVLQGERDYQVTMDDYNMWHDAFGQAANWTFKLYPQLNHLMMPGEGPANNAEYSVPGHVDESLIADIADFVKN